MNRFYTFGKIAILWLLLWVWMVTYVTDPIGIILGVSGFGIWGVVEYRKGLFFMAYQWAKFNNALLKLLKEARDENQSQ